MTQKKHSNSKRTQLTTLLTQKNPLWMTLSLTFVSTLILGGMGTWYGYQQPITTADGFTYFRDGRLVAPFVYKHVGNVLEQGDFTFRFKDVTVLGLENESSPKKVQIQLSSYYYYKQSSEAAVMGTVEDGNLSANEHFALFTSKKKELELLSDESFQSLAAIESGTEHDLLLTFVVDQPNEPLYLKIQPDASRPAVFFEIPNAEETTLNLKPNLTP